MLKNFSLFRSHAARIGGPGFVVVTEQVKKAVDEQENDLGLERVKAGKR